MSEVKRITIKVYSVFTIMSKLYMQIDEILQEKFKRKIIFFEIVKVIVNFFL